MKNLIYIIHIGMFLLLTGCEGKEAEISVSDDAASLEITFSVPEISISTKGLDNPWDEDLSGWTAWDRFTDGRDLYEVTILLIEEATGNLVGFRDMYASSAYTDVNNGFWDGSGVMDKDTKIGTAAKASFLYDNPQGDRTIEKLRRGHYQILAVSNYRPISAEITGAGAYNGLKGAIGSSLIIDTQFTELIENIEDSFDAEYGIPDFKNTTMYSDLWTFNIVTDDNHLCHKQPQPLTAVSYIELTPGLNKVDIGLERTYVRVRIEVENNSGQETLTVNDFDFCDWFTQRAVYLFNDPTDNSRNYEVRSKDAFGNPGLNTHKKSPVLKAESGWDPSQDNAIVNFAGPVEIPAGESRVIFDGYVFGSKLGATDPDYEKNDSTYQYTLDVQYIGHKYEVAQELVSEEPYTSVNDLSDEYNYLIRMCRNQKFLYINDMDQLFSDSSLASIKTELSQNNKTHLWRLEGRDVSNNQYYIQNQRSDRYIGVPDDYYLTTDVMKTDANYFTISDSGNTKYNGMEILGTNGNYINQFNWTDVGGYPLTYYHIANDDGNVCVFYPVKSILVDVRFNEDIDLNLIDPVTAAVYPVQNIKRNDFINVLVSVAYNDMDSSFDITAVTGWTDKDEQVEFH